MPAEEGTAAAQHALTVARVRAVAAGRGDGELYGWLELRPLTGRKHQLRAHCAAALGGAIVGDFKYGALIVNDNTSAQTVWVN